MCDDEMSEQERCAELQKLLDEEPLLMQKYFNGLTVLMQAIKFSRLQCIEYLLREKCVNVNQKDEFSILGAALHHAIIWRRLESVDLLLQYGADVNMQDISGVSPLMAACDITDDRGSATVEKLLAAGADIEQKSVDGWQAKIFAIRSENWKVAEILEKWKE